MGALVRIRFPPGMRGARWRQTREAMADAMLRQVQDRVRDGGDEEYRFPALDAPRADGSTDRPLFHTGAHLYESLRPFCGDKTFGVYTRFVGARLLQYGTRGKGGLLPPIRPKNAKALSFVVAGRRVFCQKVEVAPRRYFRLSERNVRDLLLVMKGNK